MNHHPNHHNHSNPNDPYTILGISPHASLSEIRSAYKQKALQYHPDKQTAKGNTDIERIQCHEQFTKINQAYQLLSDPNQRYRYDRQKQQQENERLYERNLTKPPNRPTKNIPVNEEEDMENNPFDFFDRFFQQEFGADIFGPIMRKENITKKEHQSRHDPFPFFPSLSSLFDPPPASVGNRSDRFPFAKHDPFTTSFQEIFRQQEDMMKRVEQEIREQQDQEDVNNASNKNKNYSRRYYSSMSSSSSTRKNPNGEWITTTTKTIHDGTGRPPQTVQETIVYHPDGTIKERTISGNEALIQNATPTTSIFGPQKALANQDHQSQSSKNHTRNDVNIDPNHHHPPKSWWSSLWNIGNKKKEKPPNQNQDRRDSE